MSITRRPTAKPATLPALMASAADLAGKSAPIADLLYSNIEWRSARPLVQPTPPTVQAWITQTEKLIEQYDHLRHVLIFMQVKAITQENPITHPAYHPIAYKITPAQIAAAEKAKQDFILLRADNPAIKAPQSFRQMILNEATGLVWDFETGQYEDTSTELSAGNE